jgi:hypothetical protein
LIYRAEESSLHYALDPLAARLQHPDAGRLGLSSWQLTAHGRPLNSMVIVL